MAQAETDAPRCAGCGTRMVRDSAGDWTCPRMQAELAELVQESVERLRAHTGAGMSTDGDGRSTTREGR